MSQMSNILDTFNGCTSLTDLNMNGAILPKINLNRWGLDSCTALTVDSLVSVLNALPQLDEGTSYTCTIGSTNLAKLSDEQKAIATNKGYMLTSFNEDQDVKEYYGTKIVCAPKLVNIAAKYHTITLEEHNALEEEKEQAFEEERKAQEAERLKEMSN